MTVSTTIVGKTEFWFSTHRKARILIYCVGVSMALAYGAHEAHVYVRDVAVPRARAQAVAYFQKEVLPKVVAEVRTQVMREVERKIGDLIPGSNGLEGIGKLLSKPEAPAAPPPSFGVGTVWPPSSTTPSTQAPAHTAPRGRF